MMSRSLWPGFDPPTTRSTASSESIEGRQCTLFVLCSQYVLSRIWRLELFGLAADFGNSRQLPNGRWNEFGSATFATGQFRITGRGIFSLKKLHEYLQHAAECRDMARTASPAHRQHLEQMAETWEQLAEARKRKLE